MIAELDHAAHDLFRGSAAQKLKSQHAAPQNDLDPVVQRVAMIEHDLCDTIGPQDTMDFAYCTGRIRRVMQHAVGVDHVEALRSKRQVLTIGDHEARIGSVKLKSMPRDLDRAWRQIDARAIRPTTRKLQQVRSHPTTNFEQSRAAKPFKLHDARHPRRVLFISIPLDFIKKLARPELMFAIVYGATRILAPLLTRPQFFLRQSCQRS